MYNTAWGAGRVSSRGARTSRQALDLEADRLGRLDPKETREAIQAFVNKRAPNFDAKL